MYGNYKIGQTLESIRGTKRTPVRLDEDGRWVTCRVEFKSGKVLEERTYFWCDPKLMESIEI